MIKPSAIIGESQSLSLSQSMQLSLALSLAQSQYSDNNGSPNINFDNTDVFDELKTLNVKLEQPLEKYASDLLNLPFEETCAKVATVIKDRPLKEKYFTISIQSTHQGRYWNAKKGWNILLNLLKQKYGLVAVCVDMHDSYGTKGSFNEIPTTAINTKVAISRILF